MKIAYLLRPYIQNKMPESYKDCECEFCVLPMNERRYDTLLKKYLTRRHENCPLIILPDEFVTDYYERKKLAQSFRYFYSLG